MIDELVEKAAKAASYAIKKTVDTAEGIASEAKSSQGFKQAGEYQEKFDEADKEGKVGSSLTYAGATGVSYAAGVAEGTLRYAAKGIDRFLGLGTAADSGKEQNLAEAPKPYEEPKDSIDEAKESLRGMKKVPGYESAKKTKNTGSKRKEAK